MIPSLVTEQARNWAGCELPFETHDKAQMLFCFSKFDIGRFTPKYFEIPLSFLLFHLSVYLEWGSPNRISSSVSDFPSARYQISWYLDLNLCRINNAFFGINNREMKSESDSSLAMASQPLGLIFSLAHWDLLSVLSSQFVWWNDFCSPGLDNKIRNFKVWLFYAWNHIVLITSFEHYIEPLFVSMMIMMMMRRRRRRRKGGKVSIGH